MRKILREAQSAEVGPEKSLDAQVLAFFTKAERASIGSAAARDPLEASNVEESIRRKSMRFLFEAGEEPEDGKPKINLETFASEVARLIGNAEYLLDIKGTVLKMAENYVKNAYDEDSSDTLLEILDKEYDITAESKQEEEANTNFAVGARTPTA